MRKLSLFVAFFLALVGIVSAQSLKPETPYPLRDGINEGISDSLVGTHYWYFYAVPGNNRLRVKFKQAETLFGAQINNTVLTITLYDEKKTFQITKVVTANRNSPEAVFTADKVKTKMKIIVKVSPPNQNLIRMGGEYEVEATGDVQFDPLPNTKDPIIRTYESKINTYGATKFLADGTIEATDGSSGTWKTFDSDNRIYTIVINGQKFPVKYIPGYGLVKPGDIHSIIFQELQR